jgi:DNA ligase 1
MTLLVTLVGASQRVSANSARSTKIRELASYLKSLAADEIGVAVHYLSGEIPQGRIGIGYSTLRAAASTPPAEAGTLTLTELDHALTALAAVRGSGSTGRRAEALRDLFSRATRDEQEFLLHLLVGELRQGALAGVMVDAVAAASEVPVAQVRRAAMYSKSLGAVANVALLEGAPALERFQLEMFAPILPMLAQTAADVGEALTELGGEVELEWKMDGARIQAHKVGDEVRLYTRSLNDVTVAVPEIVESVRGLSEHTLVLDGEAIAFDSSGRPHPFQVTMRRFGRKLNVEALRGELPMRAFFFDCLRVGEQSPRASGLRRSSGRCRRKCSYRASSPRLRPRRMPFTMPRWRPDTKVSWPSLWIPLMRQEIGVRVGSKSSEPTPWISWCSPRNGAMDVAPVSYPTFTWAHWIRPPGTT